MFKTADTPLEPIVYTAQQTAYLMNVSKHQILEMIRRKELRAFKISNKYMVPAEAIHEFIQQRLDEEMGILPDEALDPEDEELSDPEEDLEEEEELKAPPSRAARSKPAAEPPKEKPKPAASPFSGTNKHLPAAQEKPAGKSSADRKTESAGKSAGGKKQATTGKTAAAGKKEEPGSTFRPRRPRRYPKSDS